MFGRDSKSDDKDARPRGEKPPRVDGEERRVTAWIGPSVVIEGDLTSSEDMTVAGRIEGDVAVPRHALTIAPRARIRGSILARTVEIHGEVQGSVTANSRVEVGDTGSVQGDITAPKMVATEGAAMHGRLRIAASSDEASGKPAKEPATRSS